jgi:hypothetical protein
MPLRCIGSVSVSLALLMLSCSSDSDIDINPNPGAGSGGGTMTGNAGSSAMASAGSSGSSTGGSSSTGGGSSTGVVGPVSFQTNVWPVLVAHCSGAGCHGEGSFLPEHANPDVNLAYAEAKPVAERIAGRVSGELTPIMPQGCGPAPGFGMCLSLEEVALIRAWFDQGAPF